MFQLGQPIVYAVPEDRHVATMRHDKSEVMGSAYHPEQAEFAGIVAGVLKDGKAYDIVIFPPNRGPATVNAVPEDDLAEVGTTGKKKR